MRTGYHRVTEKMCEHCTAAFEARLTELARGAGRFCSAACKYAASRGRSILTCVCEKPGCGKEFTRFTREALRAKRRFCSRECALSCSDREQLVEAGRKGGRAPHRDPAPEVKAARSRKGGLARAARQPKERLQEIARLGVKARLALPATVRRSIARKAARSAGKRLTWFGIEVTPPRKDS